MNDLWTLMDDYLQYRRSLNFSERTIEGVRYELKLFIKFLKNGFGVHNSGKIRPEHLIALQKHFAKKTNRYGRPLSPETVNTKICRFKGFLEYLNKCGLISSRLGGQLCYVKTPQLLPKEVFKHDQIRKVLDRMDTGTPLKLRDRALFELLYSSGIRAGELVRLKVSDVNMIDGIAKVFGKGSKERMVPVGATALEFIDAYHILGLTFHSRDPEDQVLFFSGRGKSLTRKSLYCIVRSYFGPQYLEVIITPHTFRRSCTTEMIKGGANL